MSGMKKSWEDEYTIPFCEVDTKEVGVSPDPLEFDAGDRLAPCRPSESGLFGSG